MKARGIPFKTGWANGELEIRVNGERVYSYKEEHPLPSDEELMRRIEARLS